MRSSFVKAALIALVALGACSAPTGSASRRLAEQRSEWDALHLTRYSYVVTQERPLWDRSGHPMSLVVLNDTVRSAYDLTTGDSVAITSVDFPNEFPTVGALFDEADSALSHRALQLIEYDSALAYPTRIVVNYQGNPEGFGSILASGMQFLP